MIPRLLAAVLAAVAVVFGAHAVAAAAMFALMLFPLLPLIAFTIAVAVVLAFLWRIDLLTMQTGWGVIPVRVPKAAR